MESRENDTLEKKKASGKENNKEEGPTKEKAGGETAEGAAPEKTGEKKYSPESDIYCPSCGEGSAQQEDEPIIENNRIYLPMYCHMCESTWQCHFDLSGHTEINTPKAIQCEEE